MQRREFLKKAGAGTLAVGAGLSGAEAGAAPAAEHKWKLVTTWPKNFPGMGTAANRLAELIGQMSGGRLQVKVYGAGELVPAFEIFDAVSRGTAEMGHGAAYYWKGKSEAAQFFTTVPFGLTAQEMNGWLYHGGGLDLWRELYAPFGLVPAPAGNTGVQMGGWFNREITSLADLKGLKMRIPGLGGEVLQRLGGTPVNLPGGEIFTSLQSGAIDATEWVGPYNDLAFGLHKAAKFYYYPGFHEPGSCLEAIINKKALEALPKDLQSIVLVACQAVNLDLLSEYTVRNPLALEELLTKHKVDLRVYPDDVLRELRRVSEEVVTEIANKDPFSRKVFDAYSKFRDQARRWGDISELTYLKARG
jgi:TRAP-type mannitol/chloroaromatic compound transport system substrate-binding protein